MNMPLPKTTQGVYRLSVSTFYFLQGLVFASWASRIPDIKSALGLNDADLGSVLFAVPVGQMSAMALSGYLVGRCGSRKILMAASVFYPAVLVCLGMAGSFWELAAGLFFFGVAANLTNISVNTQGVGVERLYQCSIMARFHGLWSLAGFFGALLGAAMVDWHISAETHFIAIFLICMIILAVFSPSLLPRDARRSSSQGGGMFRSMDAYVLVIGLIAFGSMVSEGTMFDWSGVYFESVVKPGPGLVQMGYVAFMSTMALGFYGRPPGDALRACAGSARQRHPYCLRIARLRPVPDAVVRHAGLSAGGFWHLFHCPALLQHGREIPENDSQHGAGFRFYHRLSGVPDGAAGHWSYCPCFLPPVVFLPDCPGWTGDGIHCPFPQEI